MSRDDPAPDTAIRLRSAALVGNPNAGKSALFNALTATATAEAANYPFSTVEPNLGRIAVPDLRLGEIARIARSAKITPTQLDFVDIAGLVQGASRGEGLGNRFLSHIREVEAIALVLRCFEGGQVPHTGAINPIGDAETVEMELMLADLDSLERRMEPLIKKVRGGDKAAAAMDRTLVCALIETKDGLENIDEIMAVDGIDAFASGSNDLAQSMGLPGQPDHPDVKAAEAAVVDRIHAAGRKTSTDISAVIGLTSIILGAARQFAEANA